MNGNGEKMSILPNSESTQIREVWSDNLDQEFTLIQSIVDKYPYVGMDTEFPGVVVRVIGNFQSNSELQYQNLRDNVNLLKIIQLGLAFSDERGNLPKCGTDKYCVWQFNFREFNPDEDMHAHDSIRLLSESGMDFAKNKEKGVNVKRFSELLMTSGVVLNHNVRWLTFHGGHDFGYLVKLLTGIDLPETRNEFLKLVEMYFPVLYDIKHLMKICNLHGGLSKLAKQLGVQRIGTSHQAGSDSLLTSCTFFKMIEIYFEGLPEQYAGVLHGLGDDNVQITQ